MPDPWQTVLDRLDDAAKLADLDPDIHRLLRTPERVLEVAVPVRMDDGSIEVFTGWRVHHDTTRGPGKGGIRFHRRDNANMPANPTPRPISVTSNPCRRIMPATCPPRSPNAIRRPIS
jgi:glutamate dehydrogenase/leucine dehydrogenase